MYTCIKEHIFVAILAISTLLFVCAYVYVRYIYIYGIYIYIYIYMCVFMNTQICFETHMYKKRSVTSLKRDRYLYAMKYTFQ